MKSHFIIACGVFVGIALGFIARGVIESGEKSGTAASTASSDSRTGFKPTASSPSSGGVTVAAPPPVPQIPVTAAVSSKENSSPLLGVLVAARTHKEVVDALETLLPKLRGGNPVEFAKSALELPAGSERDMALMLSLGELGARNPAEAFQFAESLPEGPERDQAIRWIASGLPAGNLASKLSLVDSVRDSELKQLIVANVVAKEAETDPAAAMSALDLIEDPEIRSNTLAAAANSWAESDPESALRHAKTSSDPAMRTDLLLALSSSSDADSKEVFEAVLEKMPSGMAYQAAISDLFENWAAKDPSAAAGVLSQIPPGPALDSATAEVATAMAESGAPKNQVAAWIGGLPEGSARLEAMDGFYSEWGRSDPSAALTEVARLKGADRSAALTSLVNSWAGEDPASVLEWGVRGANGFDDAKNLAVQSGIQGIARFDPNEAARQVGSVPSAMQASAASALVEVWSEVDAGAAAAWLSTKPRGPGMDGAAGRLAMSLAREDPEMAMEWALAITAPQSRSQTAREVARQWKQRNPESAREFATKSSDSSVSALFAE